MKKLIDMKNIFWLTLLAFLFGCQPTTSPSDGEKSSTLTDAGKQQAALLAATAVSGQASAALTPDGHSMELTVSNSAAFEHESDLLRLHASRAAWTFFKNSGEEKPSYEQLVVKAVLKDTTMDFTYTAAELMQVKSHYQAIDEVWKKLVDGDYEGLYNMFNQTEMSSSSVASIQSYCTQLDPTLGTPEGFDFKGFSFDKISGGTPTLNLAGQLRRSIKPSPLSITIDLTKPELKGSLLAMKFAY